MKDLRPRSQLLDETAPRHLRLKSALASSDFHVKRANYMKVGDHLATSLATVYGKTVYQTNKNMNLH